MSAENDVRPMRKPDPETVQAIISQYKTHDRTCGSKALAYRYGYTKRQVRRWIKEDRVARASA